MSAVPPPQPAGPTPLPPVAPVVDEDLQLARDELIIRMNSVIGTLSGRDDVLLDIVWGRGTKAPPAWFDPRRAEITINADVALPEGTHPDEVDPTTFPGRLAHPVLVGLGCHEAGHARAHGWNTLQMAERGRAVAPRVSQAATWLEELWIEAGQLRHHPGHQRWLRAAARQLITPPPLPDDASDQQQRAAAGFCALLALGRVDAGVLEPGDVTAMETQVRAVLGDQTLAELTSLWQAAIQLPEGDIDALFDLAHQVVAALGLDDDETLPDEVMRAGTGCALGHGTGAESGEDGADPSASPSSPHPLSAAAADLATAVAEASIAQAADDLADHQATAAPNPHILAQRTAETEARAAAARAAQIAFGAGGGNRSSGPVTGQRPATAAERAAAKALAAELRRARHRGRASSVTPSALPPGRLNGRDAMLATAQHALGLPITAQPFRQLRRRPTPQPPLQVGIAVDVSGSMHATAAAMASLTWVMAQAVRQIHGRSATLAWGEQLTPVTRPGQVPDLVPQLTTDEGTEVLHEAIAALDGTLELATGTGARLLVIASDGQLHGQQQIRLAGERIDRLVRAGCGVLWLCLERRATVLPGAISVAAHDPASAVHAIGQAAITALRHSGA
ncbi:hypothetical protein GCM10010156_49370 [Planobispora rosea]|uniref:VWA domain containing CoxE-like protein n=1 Tax=Planobispora rosea TaxID=35762 RepID=A0A8J3WEP0_PLARO|nr:VWA domain-containing protein [Planobispora rosea]GGS84873.1 hypothetical protein GCM10010156_49370 [Planobispora rosea]GIH86448.1 hypothetical protein Pro02_48560 [Planobispora rosea]